MEIRCVVRDRLEGVIDLIVDRGAFFAPVFHGDAAPRPERHLPVGIEAAPGIHAHRERGDPGFVPHAPARREEIAHGHLDRRLRFAVPVEPQDHKPVIPNGRHPDAVSYTHLPSPRDRTRSRMPSSA